MKCFNTILSSQRRNGRYCVLYIWKCINNMVPNFNISTKYDGRFGRKIELPKLSGSVGSIKTIRERTINVAWAQIFNSMPRIIREYSGDFKGFKSMIDTYLMEVPDCPVLDGYILHNMDENSKPSNSLIHWNRNLNSINWIPGTLTKGG